MPSIRDPLNILVIVYAPMPTHCTITCFGFHARRIDGVKCGLFSNHAPLRQPHYVWDEYLYSVLEKVEVRVTVCVTVCVEWDDDERKVEGETRCRLIACSSSCSSRKTPRGPPGLTSPSDGRICINRTICLLNLQSTAVGQVVACAPVTQRARVRSPVGTSFLGEIFGGFAHLYDKFQEALVPKVPEYHLAINIIHNHSLRARMT